MKKIIMLIAVLCIFLSSSAFYTVDMGMHMGVSTGGAGGSFPSNKMIIEGTTDCMLIEVTSDCFLLE